MSLEPVILAEIKAQGKNETTRSFVTKDDLIAGDTVSLLQDGEVELMAPKTSYTNSQMTSLVFSYGMAENTCEEFYIVCRADEALNTARISHYTRCSILNTNTDKIQNDLYVEFSHYSINYRNDHANILMTEMKDKANATTREFMVFFTKTYSNSTLEVQWRHLVYTIATDSWTVSNYNSATTLVTGLTSVNINYILQQNVRYVGNDLFLWVNASSTMSMNLLEYNSATGTSLSQIGTLSVASALDYSKPFWNNFSIQNYELDASGNMRYFVPAPPFNNGSTLFIGNIISIDPVAKTITNNQISHASAATTAGGYRSYKVYLGNNEFSQFVWENSAAGLIKYTVDPVTFAVSNLVSFTTTGLNIGTYAQQYGNFYYDSVNKTCRLSGSYSGAGATYDAAFNQEAVFDLINNSVVFQPTGNKPFIYTSGGTLSHTILNTNRKMIVGDLTSSYNLSQSFSRSLVTKYSIAEIQNTALNFGVVLSDTATGASAKVRLLKQPSSGFAGLIVGKKLGHGNYIAVSATEAIPTDNSSTSAVVSPIKSIQRGRYSDNTAGTYTPNDPDGMTYPVTIPINVVNPEKCSLWTSAKLGNQAATTIIKETGIKFSSSSATNVYFDWEIIEYV